MKISLNWAQHYSNVDLLKSGKTKLIDKIGSQLAAVDEVIDWGLKYDGIVVARVVECVKHPNADKLQLCKIDDGKTVKSVKRDANGLVQVVCGAPNAKAGLTVAWIPPGVTVPSTIDKDPFVLESREIRGQVSNGMLASLKELGIGEDHTGILEIKAGDVGDKLMKPGTPFKKLYGLDDVVIDCENKMFTHRPDCFGMLGLARELAGIEHQAYKSPAWYSQAPKLDKIKHLPLKVEVEDPKLVPRFMAVAVSDVKVGSSPVWLQSVLARMGLRPINIIVDLTNYYMLLTGQPLHAYDYDKVKARSGSVPTLVARQARKKEKLNLLNGKTMEFNAPAIMIATDREVVGVGGVMGGADTEVDQATTNIIIEGANFDMYSIRRTAMQHGLFTDAVTRFNKGQPILQIDKVLAKLVEDVQLLAQGVQASDYLDKHRRLPELAQVSVEASFINARLGLDLTAAQMAKLLQNVEFSVKVNKHWLHITAPYWRTDIEIPEDVVEEVGRLYGYDQLPLELPRRSIKPTRVDESLEFKAQLRQTLAAAGANELLTYTFVPADLLTRAGQDPADCYQISNALSPDLQYYRPSLLPSLLEKVHPNIKAGFKEFALFEINPVQAKGFISKGDGLPIEDQRLALVFAADDKTARANYQGAPYYQAQAYLRNLLGGFNVPAPVFEPTTGYEPKMAISRAAIAPFERSRTALVKTADGQFIGEIGEFKASVRANFKLPPFVAGFELDVNQLLKLQNTSATYKPLSRFPAVEQDISLKVPLKVGYQQLGDFVQQQLVAQTAASGHLPTLIPVDIYQSKTGDKHITFRLEMVHFERTLTSQEVNELLDKVAVAAKQKLGAERI